MKSCGLFLSAQWLTTEKIIQTVNTRVSKVGYIGKVFSRRDCAKSVLTELELESSF